MGSSAGTAFVDLEPRFGAGWTAGVSRGISGITTQTGGVLQKLDRQLAGFGVPFTGQLSTIGTHLQGVTSAEGEAASAASKFGQVGTAALVGVGAAAAGLGAISAKAFLEGQDATAQYDQALQNVGESHEELEGQLDSVTKQMAKYGIENDAVELSAATLTRATKDGAKALALEGLAADLAAGRHIDLASATGILAKVETGHVALLGRLGINTKDATGATITQEEAIRRLTALYGGSAAASSKTYAGELRALGAEAHNLEEEIGGKVVPTVIGFGKTLLGGVHGIEDANRVSHGWVGTLGETGLAVGAVALVASKATGALTTMAAGEGAAAVAGGTLGVALEAVSGPLVALTAGFLLGKKVGDTVNDFLVGTKPNVDRLTASLIELEKGETGAFDFKTIGAHLNDQITRSGSLLKLPVEFGRSLLDASPIDFGPFGGGGAHKAKADVAAINDALKNVLQTEGVEKATLAYGRLTKGLAAQGVSAKVLSNDFEPFLASLDLARTKETEVTGTSKNLKSSFDELATSGLTKISGRLAIADAFDQARTAVDDLEQAKLDAEGKGAASEAAAKQEASAQRSLSDAYRGQESAASSLADAKAKLAEFDAPTDQRIRTLERTNIVDRVVTTPEEARQKEIDLLQFDEDNANKRSDLQHQIESAENGVQSATEQVADAQRSVSDASAARRKVQTDASAAIASAERKAEEAIIATAGAIEKAGITGQSQLAAYLTLVDQLAQKLDPTSPLRKNLDALQKLAAAALLGGPTGATLPGPYLPGDPSTYGGLTPNPAVGPYLPGVPSTYVKTPQEPHVTINQENHFHGSDVPTTQELDHLNRKQAVRLTTNGVRGKH